MKKVIVVGLGLHLLFFCRRRQPRAVFTVERGDFPVLISNSFRRRSGEHHYCALLGHHDCRVVERDRGHDTRRCHWGVFERLLCRQIDVVSISSMSLILFKLCIFVNVDIKMFSSLAA